MIRSDPKFGSVCFPHYTIQEGTDNRMLSGWEIKGPGASLFSPGGTKGLFISKGGRNDDQLAIGEAALDAISFLALRGWERTRVASLGGRMNNAQPKLVMAAIERMEQGTVLAICDRDDAGDAMTRELEKLFREVRRNDLSFGDERPQQRGFDWNDLLQEASTRQGRVQSPGLSLGK